jgi:hypothetical protein
MLFVPIFSLSSHFFRKFLSLSSHLLSALSSLFALCSFGCTKLVGFSVVAWACRSRRGGDSGLGFGSPRGWKGLGFWWWSRGSRLGLGFTAWWLGFLGFAAWVSVHGVVVGLGLTAWWLEGFGFLVLEPWVSAWAWVHRMVVGFSGFCSLGFGARRGGWAWVDGVVVGRVWVFGGGAVGLGLGLGSPADSPPPITHPTATA